MKRRTFLLTLPALAVAAKALTRPTEPTISDYVYDRNNARERWVEPEPPWTRASCRRTVINPDGSRQVLGYGWGPK